MSKKKAATTMRLKDFHGGSIPSDLPLPSAPGLLAKPSQERPATMPGRSERTRHVPASSPAAISPLPIPPRVIGRHFDEDERTPFDAPPRAPAAMPVATGAWAQRKEQSNPATGLSPAGSGTGVTAWSPSRVAQASALEKVISGRWHTSSRSDQLVPPVGESESRPTGDVGFGSGDSYAPGFGMDQRAVTSGNVLSENRTRSAVGQNRVLSGPGYGINVKGPEQTGTIASGYGNMSLSGSGSDRKEVQHAGVIGENQVRSVIGELSVKRVGLGSEFNIPDKTRLMGSALENSYGQGSGLESKPRPVARTGVIGENRVRSPVGQPDIGRLGSGSGSGSALDEMQGFGINRRQNYNNWEERPRSVGLVERKDKAGLAVGYEVKEIERPASDEGRSVAGSTGQKEGADRPRLKLLPRTKPVESQEIRVTEEKVGFEQSSSSTKLLVRNDNHEMNGNETVKASKEGNNMVESAVQPSERPRLNLKPRSQAIGGQTEETGGKERPSVFGGARPRELVLKDRGVDLAPDDTDKNLTLNRPNSSSAKSDPKSEPMPAKAVGNRPENYQSQQRNVRSPHTNQKEYHTSRHQHQPDTQRSSWRDDTNNGANNWKAPHQNQYQQQPRPEPDTWRKPEPAKQEDVSGSRPGKGASALELAEAFSKRVTDGKRDPVSRNPNPVVFSRLLGNEREIHKGSSPHQQINGY